MKYAADLAKKRQIKFSKGTPSEKWWRVFKKRHQHFVQRKPEGTATVRHKLMKKDYVIKYFQELKNVKHIFPIVQSHSVMTQQLTTLLIAVYHKAASWSPAVQRIHQWRPKRVHASHRPVFSKRERISYVCYMLSQIRLSVVCLSSVTLVHPT